jgi:restriction system protein
MIILGITLDIPAPWVQVLRATWPLWAALGIGAFLLRLPRVFSKPARTEESLEAQNSLAELQQLAPERLDAFCGTIFAKLGFEAGTTTHTEGGTDIVAVNGEHRYFIRCQHQPKITVWMLGDFCRAMDNANSPRGLFCSAGAFAPNAEKFAAGKPIELVDGKQLLDYARRLGIDISEPREEA